MYTCDYQNLFACFFQSYLGFEFGSGGTQLQDAAGKDVEQPSSLLEAYLLEDKYKKSGTYLNRHGNDDFAKEKEVVLVFPFCYFLHTPGLN